MILHPEITVRKITLSREGYDGVMLLASNIWSMHRLNRNPSEQIVSDAKEQWQIDYMERFRRMHKNVT